MRKNKLLLLLALLLTAATGAWAQSAFTAKEITSASQLTSTDDEAYVAACMPSDFLAVDVNVAKAWTGAPTGGSAILIYAIDGDKIKMATFLNGSNKATTGATWSIATFKTQMANSKFYYTAAAGYTVSMKDGVKDADKWTVKVGEGQAQALPIGGLKEGDAVTLTYTGRLKVKGVKATSDAAQAANIVDLSKLTENTELKDGDLVTGTLAGNYKITIADGATVTLDGVTIDGVNDTNYKWAGITCEGDATIILSGTNTVNGFYEDYPGIFVPENKTLTIQGDGSLTASSYGWGAGIGGVKEVACGNITISGGTVTATGGQYCAGIGGGSNASCGIITISGGTVIAIGGKYAAGIGGGNNASWGNITISGGTVTATGGERGAGIGGGRKGSSGSVSSGNILISGGTVTATGGEYAAGIGGGRGYNSGNLSSCGTITITTGVTKVTATMGDGADNSIGAGKHCTCGTVTIGGNVGAMTESPYTYQPSN